jgi:hypothetical protein
MKKRKTVHKPVPFINQQLRKAIYKKQMLHNKYLHLRSKKNWETYHQQRNFVNKLRVVISGDIAKVYWYSFSHSIVDYCYP